MSDRTGRASPALRAGVLALVFGLVCLVLAGSRVLQGPTFADSLAALLAVLLCAVCVTALGALAQRLTRSLTVVAVALAAALLAMLWSGALLPAQDAGWRQHEWWVLGLAAPFFLGCAWFLTHCAARRVAAAVILLAAVVPNGALLAFYGLGGGLPTYALRPQEAPQVAELRFARTPDVYLVGFLGASPDLVLRDSLGLPGSALARGFDEAGLRSFGAMFTEAAPTRNAYDMLLGMTRNYVQGIPDEARGAQFSGNHPSPLFDLFRSNGYRITTLNEDYKFGGHRGPHVDRYLVNEGYTVCEDRRQFGHGLRAFALFGTCALRRSDLFPRSRAEGPPASLLAQVIREDGEQGAPRLFVAHLKPPLHAPSEQLLRSSPDAIGRFAARYDEAVKEAAGHLQQLLAAIQANRREFVILAFGDHGVGVLQKVAGADADPAALVRDRFAVIAGVYPADTCPEHLGGDVRTTTALVRGLVTCLADGADPWPAGYQHRLVGDDALLDPQAFAY